MITRKFIENIRNGFDELGIVAKNGISFEEFEKCFIKTLNRCKSLEDAKIAISIFTYCKSKWGKIEKLFSKHLEKWQEYDYEASSNLETMEDEEAEGVYYLTNAFEKYIEIFLTSKSYDDELYYFKYKKGKYIIEEDDDYYLKYSKLSPSVMKLFNAENQFLCNIILSTTFDILLEKNSTPYELVVQKQEDGNTFIAVFKKSYIDSLQDSDMIDFKNMVADIEWDVIKPKSDVGVARITLYEDVDDFNLILYFAASTFLLFKSYKDFEKYKDLEKSRSSVFLYAAMRR